MTTEVTCGHCGEEVEQGESLCTDCDSERTEVPYAVDIAFQHLASAVDDTIGKWQNRGWNTGPVRDKIEAELRGLLDTIT